MRRKDLSIKIQKIHPEDEQAALCLPRAAGKDHDLRSCITIGQDHRIIELNLNRSKQLSALPEEVGQLTHLTKLEMRLCVKLTKLPGQAIYCCCTTRPGVRRCRHVGGDVTLVGTDTNAQSKSSRGDKTITTLFLRMFSAAFLDRISGVIAVHRPKKNE